MHNILLTYGLLNEKLTHIDEVESGLKCNCVCPFCKVKLIARKGKIKAYHFAHDKDADCGKAYETALHLLAKEIIKERKTILLPECYPSKNYYADSRFKQTQRVIIFSDVQLEKQIAQDEITIQPDALCVSNDIELLIEFAVTHYVDYDKLNKIKKLNKNCVEIDISNIELDKEKLIEVIENMVCYTKWIHNNTIEEEYNFFLENHVSNIQILIEKAFRASNIFKLPKYKQVIFETSKIIRKYDEYLNTLNESRNNIDTTDLERAREVLLNKLSGRRGNYDTIELDEARQEFLKRFGEVNNSYNTVELNEVKGQHLNLLDNENNCDTIEFDMVYSVNDKEFSFYTNNIDFKDFKPNYVLVKNNKALFCQVDYYDRLISSQQEDVFQQKLEVPIILIKLTKFNYATSELFEILHESPNLIHWISNPKAEAEINRKNKEKEEERIRIKKERKDKERIREKIMEEEERRKETEYLNDFQEFSKNPKYKLFTINSFVEKSKYCPKPRNKILEEFKNSRFYSHPILKRIIDGEFWNGIKYGDYERGHIFLNKEKIYIYKEHVLPSGEIINAEKKSCNLFYAGIMNIKEALENSTDNCKACKYLIKLLSGTYETTVVCGFK